MKYDPFFRYRLPLGGNYSTVQLKVFRHVDDKINEALKYDLSRRERAIIKGMKWANRFVDNEKNFIEIFSLYLLFLHEMTLNVDRKVQVDVARFAERETIKRAIPLLNQIFSNDDTGRFKLISTFCILLKNILNLSKTPLGFMNKEMVTSKKLYRRKRY